MMCGIAGFRASGCFQEMRKKLPNAIGVLSHRGPDDLGFFFDAKMGVGFGHRRLSIIDLSREARQPMVSENGKCAIVYNGEIYNFKEIRKTLEDLGHKFRTRSDTEVVLKSYLQWGIDALKKFVGMFAFAVWDGDNETIFLARDRLGIKPLFYFLGKGMFLFASELKAFMAFSNFGRDLDMDAIPLFLHYQYVPAPKTIFRDTFKLLPGHWAIYEKGTVTVRSYWDPPRKNRSKDEGLPSEVETVDELENRLRVSVSDRLMSDVPLGAFLSGGIDSSIVVALMQKVSTSPVRTFSIGFEESRYNEARWASRVAKHLGTDHTELYVTPGEAMEMIPRLPEIYDEPFADSSAIPTFLVSQLARSSVTVALSGDGGDEQFAGYVRYWTTRSMASGLQRFPDFVKKALSVVLQSIPANWIERCYLSSRPFLPQRYSVANFQDKWQKLISLLSHTSITDLYRMTICLWSEGELNALIKKGLSTCQFEELFRNTKLLPLLTRLMRVDQGTYLPDALLTKVDRASMANSLEVRVPLLDHRVIEYTSQLPEALKYRNGMGKYILKQLLARYVPRKLFERPKMGFGVPVGEWLRNDLRQLLLDYLSPDRLRREGLFDCAVVEEKMREHLSAKANHQYRLWSLLMWEMWRERWL